LLYELNLPLKFLSLSNLVLGFEPKTGATIVFLAQSVVIIALRDSQKLSVLWKKSLLIEKRLKSQEKDKPALIIWDS
jgi:hypothetical protein